MKLFLFVADYLKKFLALVFFNQVKPQGPKPYTLFNELAITHGLKASFWGLFRTNLWELNFITFF